MLGKIENIDTKVNQKNEQQLRGKIKAETKLRKKIREDVKFVNKSLSQRGNKFGSANQRSPLENNLHEQKKTNTDEGPIWRPTYLRT